MPRWRIIICWDFRSMHPRLSYLQQAVSIVAQETVTYRILSTSRLARWKPSRSHLLGIPQWGAGTSPAPANWTGSAGRVSSGMSNGTIFTWLMPILWKGRVALLLLDTFRRNLAEEWRRRADPTASCELSSISPLRCGYQLGFWTPLTLWSTVGNIDNVDIKPI